MKNDCDRNLFSYKGDSVCRLEVSFYGNNLKQLILY